MVDGKVVNLLLGLVKLITEEDIVLGDIGKDKVDLDVVLVVGNLTNYLEHGGDTSSSSDHADTLDGAGNDLALAGLGVLSLDQELAVSFIFEVTERTTSLDGASYREVFEVLSHLALVVDLDDKVKVADVALRGDGSVSTRDLLSVLREPEEEMLSDGQTKDVVLGGEGEAEEHGVVVHVLLLDELEGLVLGSETCWERICIF